MLVGTRRVGRTVGRSVGTIVGTSVGSTMGASVGAAVGGSVGNARGEGTTARNVGAGVWVGGRLVTALICAFQVDVGNDQRHRGHHAKGDG